MKLSKIAAVTAALSLATAPVMAQVASPVSKLSVSAAQASRTTATVDKESKLEGSSGILIAALATAAVIAGIIVIADGESKSP